jgi:hypothetical protein
MDMLYSDEEYLQGDEYNEYKLESTTEELTKLEEKYSIINKYDKAMENLYISLNDAETEDEKSGVIDAMVTLMRRRYSELRRK